MNWNEFIEQERKKDYFKNIESFLEKREYFPEEENIFKAFELTPFDRVKVVILGQDPYHTPGMAQGIAFSVPEDFTPKPPSLKNILKELEDDIGSNAQAIKTKGDLTVWAKQGVLLLNTVLTVDKGAAMSHRGIGWEIFTKEVIKLISNQKEGIVFILWGREAKKYKKLIDNHKHYIIESAHPSPLSAYRGFFGSKPFSKANEYVTIEW